MNIVLKPYPGEDEESFIKRKAYFIRILKRRIAIETVGIPKKKNNSKPISTQDKKQIDAFWSRYLSDELRDCLVNYTYYDIYNNFISDGEQLCHYIPDSFYQTFIDEYYTNPQHSFPCDDKNLYDLYFHDVNRPETIFRKTGDFVLDGNYHEISLREAIDRCKDENEVILKKGKFSMAGEGIMFWNKNQPEEDLLIFLSRSSNVICERIIKQHHELSRLNSTSVNTLRIMTLVFDGQVHVLSSVLRMGVKGSKVDNASQGGIVCGIKPNGQLKNVAYNTSGKKFFQHPQGVAFESVTIPSFDECRDLVTSLAKRFSSVSRLISWDLAIDELGHPMLIEFNLTIGELDFHQFCNGPIFGNMTEDVLKDVFSNSYTLHSIIKSFK